MTFSTVILYRIADLSRSQLIRRAAIRSHARDSLARSRMYARLADEHQARGEEQLYISALQCSSAYMRDSLQLSQYVSH